MKRCVPLHYMPLHGPVWPECGFTCTNIPANSHALGMSLMPVGRKLRSHASSRLRNNFSRLVEKLKLLQLEADTLSKNV